MRQSCGVSKVCVFFTPSLCWNMFLSSVMCITCMKSLTLPSDVSSLVLLCFLLLVLYLMLSYFQVIFTFLSSLVLSVLPKACLSIFYFVLNWQTNMMKFLVFICHSWYNVYQIVSCLVNFLG